MGANALVVRVADRVAEGRARSYGYRYVVAAGWELPAARTLFVAAGMAIPYALLQAGFGFLERWEVAAPLGARGVLAADVGTSVERAATAAVIGDLRVPVYADGLLFVRDCEGGREFLARWHEESAGGELCLAFLRALYAVKPLICALPRTWLGAPQPTRGRVATLPGTLFRPGKPGPLGVPVLTEVTRPQRRDPSLVQVEIAPGRYVQCRAGEEEAMRQRFAEQMTPRRERRAAVARGRRGAAK